MVNDDYVKDKTNRETTEIINRKKTQRDILSLYLSAKSVDKKPVPEPKPEQKTVLPEPVPEPEAGDAYPKTPTHAWRTPNTPII